MGPEGTRRTRPDLPVRVLLCFNAWLAFESGRETDRGMVNWLKGASRSQLRVAFDQAIRSSVFHRDLSALAGLSPVSSSTPGRWPNVTIQTAEDFPGIVEGIYRVRCNLFHGGKRADDVRDQKLVRVCAQILEKWVGNLVGSSGGARRELRQAFFPAHWTAIRRPHGRAPRTAAP